MCNAVGSQETLPPTPLNLSKHLLHPPWQILWHVGLKSRPCVSFMNAGGFPYLTLHRVTAGSTCAHIRSSTEKCGSIWWLWRRCMCTTALQHEIEQSCPRWRLLCYYYCVSTVYQKCEFSVYTLEFIPKLLYVLYGYHHLSFFLPLSVLFSLSDPVSAVLHYCEVMMRNRVIMPVVKPQATQQMCFRDPAFVSEWIRSLLW